MITKCRWCGFKNYDPYANINRCDHCGEHPTKKPQLELKDMAVRLRPGVDVERLPPFLRELDRRFVVGGVGWGKTNITMSMLSKLREEGQLAGGPRGDLVAWNSSSHDYKVVVGTPQERKARGRAVLTHYYEEAEFLEMFEPVDHEDFWRVGEEPSERRERRVRSMWPRALAKDIVAAQPMTAPVSKVFKFDYQYGGEDEKVFMDRRAKYHLFMSELGFHRMASLSSKTKSAYMRDGTEVVVHFVNGKPHKIDCADLILSEYITRLWRERKAKEEKGEDFKEKDVRAVSRKLKAEWVPTPMPEPDMSKYAVGVDFNKAADAVGVVRAGFNCRGEMHLLDFPKDRMEDEERIHQDPPPFIINKRQHERLKKFYVEDSSGSSERRKAFDHFMRNLGYELDEDYGGPRSAAYTRWDTTARVNVEFECGVPVKVWDTTDGQLVAQRIVEKWDRDCRNPKYELRRVEQEDRDRNMRNLFIGIRNAAIYAAFGPEFKNAESLVAQYGPSIFTGVNPAFYTKVLVE